MAPAFRPELAQGQLAPMRQVPGPLMPLRLTVAPRREMAHQQSNRRLRLLPAPPGGALANHPALVSYEVPVQPRHRLGWQLAAQAAAPGACRRSVGAPGESVLLRYRQAWLGRCA